MVARQVARSWTRRFAPQARRADQRLRLHAFVARTRAAALLADAYVELDIADDVWIGSGTRVWFEPGTHNLLHVGPGGWIGERVAIQLKGGRIRLGPRVEIRRDCVLNVAGELQVHGDTPISWGSIIHCSNDIVLERMVGIAEQVTLADSSHYFTEPDEHFWHNVRTGSIRIGTNTWICPKVTVTRGADIGSHCIVGSNSVVVGKVADGSIASGVPATCRPLDLPWRSDDRGTRPAGS